MDSARLLRAADDALYLAKRQGRNLVLAAERQLSERRAARSWRSR
jgi:hypothetical protein